MIDFTFPSFRYSVGGKYLSFRDGSANAGLHHFSWQSGISVSYLF